MKVRFMFMQISTLFAFQVGTNLLLFMCDNGNALKLWIIDYNLRKSAQLQVVGKCIIRLKFTKKTAAEGAVINYLK